MYKQLEASHMRDGLYIFANFQTLPFIINLDNLNKIDVFYIKAINLNSFSIYSIILPEYILNENITKIKNINICV